MLTSVTRPCKKRHGDGAMLRWDLVSCISAVAYTSFVCDSCVSINQSLQRGIFPDNLKLASHPNL